MRILAVIDLDYAANCSSAIATWVQDVKSEGHQAISFITPESTSVIDVATVIEAGNPDHVQIFGKVAIPKVRQGPDGHGLRPGADDCVYATSSLDGWGYDPVAGSFNGRNLNDCRWPSAAVRSVSRVYFDDLAPAVPGNRFDLFNAWMTRNHAYRSGEFEYDNRAVLVDYLNYIDANLQQRLIDDMADVIGGADRVLDLHAPTNAEVNLFFQANAGKSFMLGSLFAGGGNQDGGVGEWYVGHDYDFASGLVQICGLILFCSYGWEFDWWPLMRDALVGGSQWVWYDWWGYGSVAGWDEHTPIGKVVQLSHYQDSFILATLMGDGTLVRRFPVVSASDWAVLQQTVAQLVTRIASVEAKVSGSGTGTGDGGGTGDTSGKTVTAWNLGGPDIANFKGVSGPNWMAPNPASVAGVINAAPIDVYRTGWTGANFTWQTGGITPGNYTVLLHGTEPQYTSTGKRVQAFTVNGKQVTVDWFALAGAANKATAVSVAVTVAADGILVVSDAAGAGMACWLCAVELKA